MSVSIEPGISELHRLILSQSDPDLTYIVCSLPPSNELKLQDQGAANEFDDDFAELFSESRIQFAFARVPDKLTKLNRFVLIQWCGESVPEGRKGRFSSQAAHVQRVLSGAHIVIQARDPADLEPQNLTKKISAASGSKYGAGNAATAAPAASSRYEAPKPVGSSYTPVGRPDIASLRASAKAPSRPDPVGTAYTSKRDELSDIRSGAQSTPTAPPPAPRPVVQPSPIAAPPRAPLAAPTPAPVVAPEPPKPEFEKMERPAAVGTAYTPVSLGKPGKLGNRFPFGQQAEPAPAPGPAPRAASSNLTWSQRQALAKKQKEEEEAADMSAAGAVATSTAAAVVEPEPPSAPIAPPPPSMPSRAPAAPEAPPAPAPPPMFTRPNVVPPPPADDDFPDPPDHEDEGVPPPPAPPPPPVFGATTGAQMGAKIADAQAASASKSAEKEVEYQAAKLDNLALAGDSATRLAAVNGPRARVLYDYEAAEDGELNLTEGEILEAVEQIDEGWWSATKGGQSGLFPANYVELLEEDAADLEPEQNEVPVAPPAPPMPGRPEEPASAGLTATALYSYAKDEANEVSFEEGETITAIEQVDEAWWEGANSAGERGLFPAAYVQLNE